MAGAFLSLDAFQRLAARFVSLDLGEWAELRATVDNGAQFVLDMVEDGVDVTTPGYLAQCPPCDTPAAHCVTAQCYCGLAAWFERVWQLVGDLREELCAYALADAASDGCSAAGGAAESSSRVAAATSCTSAASASGVRRAPCM